MINKKTFIFNTLAEALTFKIGADPKNTTYRLGSFAEDAEIKTGEPDIPYYSEILIRETNQIWRCNQFWLNDVERSPDNDLATERAERMAADKLLRNETDRLTTQANSLSEQLQTETNARKEADENLQEVLNNCAWTAWQVCSSPWKSIVPSRQSCFRPIMWRETKPTRPR